MSSSTRQYWLRLQGLPLDRDGGDEAKKNGIYEVVESNDKWIDAAVIAAIRWLNEKVTDFTGEDIRSAIALEVGEPMHSNAWGGLINTLARRKRIVKTGEWIKSTIRSNHARMIPVYRKP